MIWGARIFGDFSEEITSCKLIGAKRETSTVELACDQIALTLWNPGSWPLVTVAPVCYLHHTKLMTEKAKETPAINWTSWSCRRYFYSVRCRYDKGELIYHSYNIPY